MTEAARAWFILQCFGARAAILHGGWSANSEVPILGGSDRQDGARFHARHGSGHFGLVERMQLLAALG